MKKPDTNLGDEQSDERPDKSDGAKADNEKAVGAKADKVIRTKPREGSRATRQGIIIATRPDFCRLPDGSIIPYISYALQDEDGNTAPTVRMTGQRAHTSNSIILRSHGAAPAGVGVGVKSGTVGGACWPKTYSKTVRIEGQYAVRHDDEWWMNDGNTVGKLQWIVDPDPGDDEEEEDDDGDDVSDTHLEHAASAIAIPHAVPGIAPPFPSLPSALPASHWWKRALPAIGAGVIARLPQLVFFYAEPVGDGGLSGALKNEAAHIFRELEFMQSRGLSKEEVNAWYENEWDELYQRRPELFQQHIWDNVFPPSPEQLQAEQKKRQEEEAALSQASLAVDSVRITGREEDRRRDCEHLACPRPLPGSKYRGGAHKCTKQPTGDQLDSHHMPADAYTHLSREEGPAIQMEPAHHKETASNSRNTRRVNYNKQAALLAQGKFMEAFHEDVQDLYAAILYAGGNPQDYAIAVAQTSAYTACLHLIGRVQ